MSFLGYILEVLLVTDLYVFFYNFLLSNLNQRFPPILSQVFYVPGAAPEPYEIPLYLLLAFIAVIFIHVIHGWIIKKFSITEKFLSKKTTYKRICAIILVLVLVKIFIVNIASYPLKGEYNPYTRPDWNLTTIIFIGFISIVGVVTAQLIIIERFLKNVGEHSFLILSALVLVIITIFIFEPRFPIFGQNYAFFYGPIWEIFKGKTILTDVPSRYGILPILFFASLLKLQLFQLPSLQIFFWFLFVIEYFLIFYLIFKVSRSIALSTIALFSVITINYFSISHIPLFTPQTGPLRWLPMFVAILILYKQRRIDSKILIFFIALSLFWITDTGLYIVLAYFLTLFLMVLKKELTIKKAFLSAFLLFLSSMIVLLFLEGAHLLAGYRLINIFVAFRTIHQYALTGYDMIKMSPQTYFWFVPLLFFASIIYFFRRAGVEPGGGPKRSGYFKYDPPSREAGAWDEGETGPAKRIAKSTSKIELPLLLFAANLSFFGGIYFVGRSHPHNLFWITPLALLNLFLFAALGFTKIQSGRTRLLILVILFVLTVVYPAYNRKEIITEQITGRYTRFVSGDIFQTTLDTDLEKKYSKEKKLINDELKEAKVAILHVDDTYLLYITGKQSLLTTNPQIGILTKEDVESALKEAYLVCPKKIAVDCRFVGKCSENWVFVGLVNYLVQPYLLDSLGKKCHVVYKPTKCTDQLCIAEGQ